MIIDSTTYQLPENNYIKEESIKKQIVISHSSSSGMNHYTKWVNRLNGNYKKTAAFTIDYEGNVFQHFDPIYYSNILSNIDLDSKSIVIMLENQGWLGKDKENNGFIDWIGNIYNRPEAVFERKWRGYTFWAPYSEAQMSSAVELATHLCNEFYIDKFAIPHNTKVENMIDYTGVLYKSNLEKYYTDLSPAWNCEKFKAKLETNEKGNH